MEGGTVRYLERLEVDAPWGERAEPKKLPVILQPYGLDRIAEPVRAMLEDEGLHPKVVVVAPNFYFSFPGGEIQPCAILEDAVPGAKWHMAFAEDSGKEPTPDNVMVFTLHEEAVH